MYVSDLFRNVNGIGDENQRKIKTIWKGHLDCVMTQNKVFEILKTLLQNEVLSCSVFITQVEWGGQLV
jgi:hypothetical protein